MIAYIILVTLLVALIASVIASATRDRRESIAEDALPAPEARQEALLDELRELEFDHETGVVTEEEYRRLRPELSREAVAAHEEVDSAVGPFAARGNGAGAPAVCASCGEPVRPGARFCAGCGAPVVGNRAREQGAGPGGREDPPGSSGRHGPPVGGDEA